MALVNNANDMKYHKAATQRNAAQLLLNSFLCCVKLRAGSLVIACVNVVSIYAFMYSKLKYDCRKYGGRTFSAKKMRTASLDGTFSVKIFVCLFQRASV